MVPPPRSDHARPNITMADGSAGSSLEPSATNMAGKSDGVEGTFPPVSSSFPGPPSTALPDHHAHQHIARFLTLETSPWALSLLQVVRDGSKLTAQTLLSSDPDTLSIDRPILVQDTPQSIGMKVPAASAPQKQKHGSSSGPAQQVSVRDVANILEFRTPVSVIDVKHQEELDGWTLGDLVDYFEDEERLAWVNRQQQDKEQSNHDSLASPSQCQRRPRRAAAQRSAQTTSPRVLNQISLEFSLTPLAKLVSSPQCVRDLDWIDHAWPQHRRLKGDYPLVQYYCLTSTAGAYTDFHIDFGGTSVWYHVLSGQKVFLLIPPTPVNLQVYEEWLCLANQSEIFLPDLLSHNDPGSANGIIKVTLQPSQTMMIPTGWIHAVYTPKDSVVLGGNFMHGLGMKVQLDVYCLESRTNVPGRFRFPFFLSLMFYAGGMYLRRMKTQKDDCAVSEIELEQLGALLPCLEEWWTGQTDSSIVPAANEAAESSGCASVEDMLWQLHVEIANRLGHEIPVKPAPPIVNPLKAGYADKNTEPSSALKEMPRLRFKNPARLEKKPSPDPEGSQHEANEFRIFISPTSNPVPPPICAVAPNKRKSLVREELDGFVTVGGDEDDEWQPEAKHKRKRKRPVKSRVFSPDQLLAPNAPRDSSVGGRLVVPAKKQSTVRQRLTKRLR